MRKSIGLKFYDDDDNDDDELEELTEVDQGLKIYPTLSVDFEGLRFQKLMEPDYMNPVEESLVAIGMSQSPFGYHALSAYQ